MTPIPQTDAAVRRWLAPRLLPQRFFQHQSDWVARNLLGQLLVIDRPKELLVARIVETEAYFGADDPASRAYGGKVTTLNRWMWEEGGTVFVYVVHGNLLFNVITGARGDPQGVLVRAVEPLYGINHMLRRRPVRKLTNLTSGPGKLTQALGIRREHTGLNVTDPSSPIRIHRGRRAPDGTVARSHRIGVRQDLPQLLRFFIRKNPFVSSPKKI